MKRVLVGLILGFVLASRAFGQSEEPRLAEIPIAADRGASLVIPREYGHLAEVAVTANVHYLYFEDGEGTLRLILVGPRGSATKIARELQLLGAETYTIKRRAGSD